MAREWYSRPINSGYTVVDGTTTGNYNNGVPNTYVKTWMEYKVLQDSTDIVNNRSRIDVKLYSQVIDGGSSTGMSSATTANNYGYVGYDNANQSYLSTTYNFNSYALNKFADATLTIPHNADGTKTITLQGAFQTLAGTWAITGGSASASITLPTIARGTELVSVANPYYGHSTYFTLSRKASGLREQVTMTSGSTTLTIKQTSTSDVNFYYELARSYTPNTTKPSASTWTISVKTYNGNTLVETKTYSQVFSIADGDEGSYRPLFTLSDITVQGYNDVVSAFGTNMVAGYSKMNVITAKSAIQLKYGATVASRVVTFQDGRTVSGIDDTNHISNKIMTAGNYSWRYVVVDSRGFSYEASGSAYVYGYSAPSIDVTECYRGDSSGNASTSGTYVWATATASCTSVAGNTITAFKGQVAGFSAVNLTNGTRVQLTNNASATNVYTVTFTVTDTAGTTVTVTRSIPSEDIPINIREGGKGVGIGAYCEGEGLISVGYQFSGAIKSKGDRIFGTCNHLDSALIEQGALDGSTGAEVDWTARIRSEFTPIKPNTTYTVSWSGNAIPCMFYYSSAKAYVSCELTSTEVSKYTFTTPSGVGFVKFTWGKYGNANISPSDIANVQSEEGDEASPYMPYAMDNVELTDAVRPQVIEAVLLANTSATLDYTGVSITLPQGWWAIDAYATYNYAVPVKVALYQYQNGFHNLLSVTEIQNSMFSQYLHTSCVLNNGQTNDIRVYAQYESATSNEIRIRAKRLV